MTVSVTDIPAPDTPQNPSASAGAGEVSVSWSAVSDADTYNLYAAEASGVSSSNYSIKAEAITGNSHTLADLDNGTTYYFVVVANNSEGSSDASDEVSAMPDASLANRVPAFTSASSVSVAENTSGVFYTASASDADGDSLALSISGGSDQSKFSIDSASGGLSFVAAPDYEAPSDAGGDNVYQVTLSVSDGEDSASLDLTVNVTDVLAPEAPQNPSASAGDTNITISWDEVSDADVYHLYMAQDSGVSPDNYSSLNDGMAHKDIDSNSYIHIGLSNDTTYYFVVVAGNGEGNSSASTEVNATPEVFIPETDPVANAGDNQSVYEGASVDLDGSGSSDVNDNIATYDWQQTGSGDTVSIISGSSAEASFIAPEVSGTITLTFKLTVTDDTQRSSSSSTEVVVQNMVLPSDFAATEINAASVDLSWSAASDDLIYNIYVSSDASCDPVSYTNCADGRLYSDEQPGYMVAGLSIASDYYFWLELESGALRETSSSPLGLTTNEPQLNDSGIEHGGDYLTRENNDGCFSDVDALQDCEIGRDATHNDDSDGHAGFSYTKIDSNGEVLPNYAVDWSCVQDNVTGLIWEVKTNDGGLHDRDDYYTWYDGATGSTDTGGDSCYGYQADDTATHCNTQAFIDRVNAVGMCGANDWRLPSVEELRSIGDYSIDSRGVDNNYFPNVNSETSNSDRVSFWTSEIRLIDTDYDPDYVYVWYINFSSSGERVRDHGGVTSSSSFNGAMLVRSTLENEYLISTSHDNSRYEIHNDGTATDTETGLMWMRCALGQEYLESSCSGSASPLTWGDALGAADSWEFANYDDWRLPTIKELATLVERRRSVDNVLSINDSVFMNMPIGGRPNVNGNTVDFWTSSPGSSDYSSYVVNFATDSASHASGTFSRDSGTEEYYPIYTRLVRNTQ